MKITLQYFCRTYQYCCSVSAHISANFNIFYDLSFMCCSIFLQLPVARWLLIAFKPTIWIKINNPKITILFFWKVIFYSHSNGKMLADRYACSSYENYSHNPVLSNLLLFWDILLGYPQHYVGRSASIRIFTNIILKFFFS